MCDGKLSNETTIDYWGSCRKNCSNVECFRDDQHCILTPGANGRPHCVSRLVNCSGFSPVCDVDGNMFINDCHLYNSPKEDGTQRILAHRGPCRLEKKCTHDICSRRQTCVETLDDRQPVCIRCPNNTRMVNRLQHCHFELICGDDNVQYYSMCQLVDARCFKKQYIKIAYYGTCLPTMIESMDEYE
ncbi:unnamed protein product [Didymodactylos carnosus]|uniref:Kazal-like domain-containing protein n=1 Tax=Didymodactylos carnosus TaxID=1234261 RepID=A0A813WX89_9BILA|nr:unnamed protein product [Didymodactylos carnosus]CAF1161081.1 unnamed protein product [Didymodactylos carnosus]CAF3644552.1 unnamed protein product [Didymodactylos carnosus]CAF3972814.1 unnamed protein product [Didymodactylos carnosus]